LVERKRCEVEMVEERLRREEDLLMEEKRRLEHVRWKYLSVS